MSCANRTEMIFKACSFLHSVFQSAANPLTEISVMVTTIIKYVPEHSLSFIGITMFSKYFPGVFEITNLLFNLYLHAQLQGTFSAMF